MLFGASSSIPGSGRTAGCPGRRTSTGRGRPASRRRYPLLCSVDSWYETLDVLVSPTASPISRIDGGYPRRCTGSRITCSTLRCRQVSTWPGSGRSGSSVTIVGTVPFGFRPGLPLGLTAGPALLPSAVEACRAVSSSLLLLIIGPPARRLRSGPTLALAALNLKHLFDGFRKCRTSGVRLYRIFVRSNEFAIEQRYDRTAVRIKGGFDGRAERCGAQRAGSRHR